MRAYLLLVLTSLMLTVTLAPFLAHAEEEDSAELDEIEAELERSQTKKTKPEAPTVKEEKFDEFSDLGTLSAFSEVAVVQKRYMPKTNRFQLFAGLNSMMNDPWFSSYGLNGALGFNLTEAWGVELNGFFLSTSKRQATTDLNTQNGVDATNFVTPKSYTGASLVWTPIYGKMSRLGNKIIPFDMYFQVGGGNTNVDNGTGGSTLHFATGQIYALSKSMGLRWDFTWNSYSATPTGKSAQTFNNLLLSFGVSFFVPEAKYR